jgi:hypothetical protein
VSGADNPQAGSCVALLSSDQKAADLAAAFKAGLTAQHWKFSSTAGVAGSTVLQLESPRCGTVQVIAVAEGSSGPDMGNTVASLILLPCSQVTPTP